MQTVPESKTSLASMILGGASRLIAGRLARVIITLAGLAILSRLLTPAEFGVVAITVMMLPLAAAITHGAIEVPILRRDKLDDDGVSSSMWLGYFMMVGLIGIIWTSAPIISYQLNLPDLTDALRLMAFGLLLQPGCSTGEAILRRKRRFASIATLMPLTGGVYVISAIIMALNGMGFWSLIYGQLLSLLTRTLGVIWLSGVPLLPSSKIDSSLVRGVGGLGMLSGVLNWAAHNMDTVFVGWLLGPSGAGIYSRAYNITTQLKDPFTSLNFAIREAFVSLRQVGNDRASRATMLGLRLVFLVSASVVAIVIVMRNEIVMILLGAQWTDVTLPLAILLAALPFRVTRAYLNNFSQVSGSLQHLVKRNFALCLLMLASLWFFSRWGLFGIAAGVSLVHTASCLLFPGGELDTEVAGTLSQRAMTMLPGFMWALLLVVLGEMVNLVFEDSLALSSILAKCFLCAIWCVLMSLSWPARWLPGPISVMRSRILTLGR